VAAASIVAKVERDFEIQKLQKIYKDIGSGYPSDSRTINFLKSIPNGEMPDFVRKSWATLERIR
jgi:ribonuclease HII